MDAYIRKLYNGFYYIVEGRPEDKQNWKIIDRPYSTRRQAMRYAKQDGYNIIIQSRLPQENEKKSLLENLAAAKQKAAEQRPVPARSAAKSRPSALGL